MVCVSSARNNPGPCLPIGALYRHHRHLNRVGKMPKEKQTGVSIIHKLRQQNGFGILLGLWDMEKSYISIGCVNIMKFHREKFSTLYNKTIM